MLNIFRLTVGILSDIMQIVIILSVVMQNAVMPSDIMLNVIILSIIVLNVVMLSDIMLNVIILSVVMLNVVAPIKRAKIKLNLLITKVFFTGVSKLLLEFAKLLISARIHRSKLLPKIC